jgi:hypothetical protein
VQLIIAMKMDRIKWLSSVVRTSCADAEADPTNLFEMGMMRGYRKNSRGHIQQNTAYDPKLEYL